MFAPILIFIVMIVLAVGMLVFASTVKPKYKGDKKKTIKEPEEIPMEKHVTDLINVDEVFKNGIYRIGSMYFGIGVLNGTNFSVISVDNQNSKEDRIVELTSDAVKYPTQTIATTIVANTDMSAEAILKRAKNDDTINPAQKIYMKLYAQFLKELKAQRQVLSCQNWYVVGSRYDDDDPEDAIIKRFTYLSDQFRRVGIVLTRVTTDVEVYDIIHQILLPDRIIAPSERYANGVTEPLHWGESEIKGTPA